MATNILIQNCSSGDVRGIDLSSATNLALNWSGNSGQISISEINYCPPGAVLTFRHLGADVYVYVTQGLVDSTAAYPACVSGNNPDNTSYLGPVDEIVIDTSAVTYPISISNDTASGTYSEWELEIALTHTGNSATKIYYTLDGSDPLISNTALLYDDSDRPLLGGENLKGNIVFVKAIAVNDIAGQASALTSYLYVFNRPMMLNASVSHGYHVDRTPIALSVNYSDGPTPVIYYTLDGADPLYFNGQPGFGVLEYTGPITPPSNEFMLKAVAVQQTLLRTHYSNFIANFYKYEEDVLTLEATPAGGVFPQTQLAINLATNDVNAVIKYTLDGSSPLIPSARTYNDAFNISTQLDSQDFRLRAVAMTERLISEPIDITYTLYDYTGDADKDEISNLDEGGPGRDTDGDGVADMFDADSDNDGVPDYVEGTADANGNNIPAFQDASETIPFWYSISGIPENGVLVNGLQYEIRVICYGSEGYLDIHTENKALVFSETSVVLTPGEEKIIYMLVPEVMENKCSPLWSGEPFDVRFTVSHTDPSTGLEASEMFLREYSFAPSTEAVPYAGNLITWTKLASAKFYGVYRKNPGDSDYTRVIKLLHDSYHSYSETQQYLDREGETLSLYRVTAITNKGESDMSNALHAADSELDTCAVIGHLSDIAGSSMHAIRVSARVEKAPAMQKNILLNAYEIHAYTDIKGQFVLALPKGSTCIIKLEQAGLRKKVVVPYAESIDFDALLSLNSEGV